MVDFVEQLYSQFEGQPIIVLSEQAWDKIQQIVAKYPQVHQELVDAELGVVQRHEFMVEE